MLAADLLGGAVIWGWVKVLWCTELLLGWATQEQLAGPGGGHQESDLQQNLKIYLKRPILGSTIVLLSVEVIGEVAYLVTSGIMTGNLLRLDLAKFRPLHPLSLVVTH